MRRRSGQASFGNDDYSRYSGPDFHQDYLRPINLDRLSLGQGIDDRYYHPGGSGKDRNEGSWFNESQYGNQKNFIGKGPKGYRRKDSYIHEDACEALTREPYVDAREIEVDVQEGILTLRGSVPDRPTKRRAQACVEDLTVVQDVINELRVVPVNEAGTQALIKNQSRLPS